MSLFWEEDTSEIAQICQNRFDSDELYNLLSIDVLDADSELEYFPIIEGRWIAVGTIEHIESGNQKTLAVEVEEDIRLNSSKEELADVLYGLFTVEFS